MTLSGNLPASVLADIPTLQNAGKSVMVSLGGEVFSSDVYKTLAVDVSGTASRIAAIVTQYGFDGVDIDYEDTAALAGTGSYDGVQFMIDLTAALYQALPSGSRTISHAPQPPYFWSPAQTYAGSAYGRIMASAGDKIDFLNIQYYNNDWYCTTERILTEGPSSVTGLLQGGLPASKLVMGKPVSQSDAGSGWISVADFADTLVIPAKQQCGPDFGGVMGWQASSDPKGEWIATLAAAMGVS